MPDYKEVFKKRRKNQRIGNFVAVVVVLGLYMMHLQTLAIVAIAGLVIFSKVNWKCPKCNKYLGKGNNPTHCQSCGEELY